MTRVAGNCDSCDKYYEFETDLPVNEYSIFTCAKTEYNEKDGLHFPEGSCPGKVEYKTLDVVVNSKA